MIPQVITLRVNLRHLRHIFRNSHSFYPSISATILASVIICHQAAS